MFAENVRYIRALRGYSQLALSKLLGYTSAAIVSQWEAGRATPPADTLTRLAAMANCSVDDLLYRDLSKPLNRDEYPRASCRIPVYSAVHAGIPCEAIEEPVDWEDIPEDWTAGGREYFAVKVKGDCMEPEYRQGDVVIVQYSSTCNSGDDAIVRVNGDDAMLRRVIINGPVIALQPLNPSYAPTLLSGAAGEPPVSVIGVVRELRRRKL